MDIPIHADVYCDNVECGRVARVVLEPKTQQVTHIVVQEKGLIGGEYLIPLNEIVDSSPHRINLRMSKNELVEMEPFIETDFIEADGLPVNGELYDTIPEMYSGYALWPYAPIDEPNLLVKHEMTPPGEVTMTSGSQVIARDGTVGRLDEFLTDPISNKITHLILRKGHFWGEKDVTIPVEQIDRIESDSIYLKLNKAQLAELPATRRN